MAARTPWSAISIGSLGSAALASAAVSTSPRYSCGTVMSGPSVKASPEGSHNSASDMRFSVSVPVLSVHSTVADPSVSIADARRVSTPTLPIRHAPIARNTVSTTGNSSGSIDMPIAIPASTASIQPPRNSP